MLRPSIAELVMPGVVECVQVVRTEDVIRYGRCAPIVELQADVGVSSEPLERGVRQLPPTGSEEVATTLISVIRAADPETSAHYLGGTPHTAGLPQGR